jgi:hypothetical protein
MVAYRKRITERFQEAGEPTLFIHYASPLLVNKFERIDQIISEGKGECQEFLFDKQKWYAVEGRKFSKAR